MPLSNTLLELLRASIGHSKKLTHKLTDEEWVSLYKIATLQGVNGILIDGIEQLPEDQRPPKELLLQWIGDVLQSYEYRFELYRRTIAEMAAWYNSHGFKMMVLKGYACCIDWPKPEHRPCGDIDIWLFGKQKEADALMAKELGLKVDSSHHHHTVFNWRDFSIENHYDFINVHRYSSNRKFELLLKELGKNDSHYVILNGEKVFLPAPNLSALFLLRHSMMDFISSSLSIRQILDWAFLVQNHSNELDWDWLESAMNDYHMMDYFNVINAICVDDLGFDSEVFPQISMSSGLKNRVLEDVINPSFVKEEPKSLLPQLIYKYKRWQGNSWKQSLCFKESRWNNFCCGLKGHLLKPTSF